MIDKVLSLILDELNVFLSARFAGSEVRAVLSDSVKRRQTAAANRKQLVLSLVKIEREAALNLNIYLRVAANFGANYVESLQFLSAALEFFQERPVFTAPGIDRLNVQMLNLTIQDLHSLWSISGSNYLPSVLYKVRMVTIQQG